MGIVAFVFSGMASAITKQPQTIAFSPASVNIGVGGTVVVKATATSGLSVSLTQDSTSTHYCSFNRQTGLVTGLAVGTCKINASQGGNTTYASAKAVLSIPVTPKLTQTISFGAAPNIAMGGTGTVMATASSGLQVTLASTTQAVCLISGNAVKSVTAGWCTITANQVGNATYAPALQATQSFNIAKLTQTISFGAAPNVIVRGAGTVTTSASSGLSVTLTSTSPTTCSITANTVTGLKVGTCTIAANQAGNTNYSAAPKVTQSFSVTQQTSNGGVNSGNGSGKLAVTAPFNCLTLATSGNAADDGRRAYIRLNCASCHGQDASGSMGPNIQGEGGDVVEAVNGEGAMPSYAGFLCPNDVVDLQAYLNSVSKTTKFLDWDVHLEKLVSGTPAPAPTGVIPGP